MTEMPDFSFKLANFVKRSHYQTMGENSHLCADNQVAPMNGSAEHSNGSTSGTSAGSSRQNVRCPTCQGIGWVRKEEEGQLVALIPLNDHRLKPRRTYIYVFLAVAVCAIAGGLCAFFLYPRDVNLYSLESMALLQPDEVHFANQSVDFVVTTYVNVMNSNYYPTPITSILVSVMMNKKELARTKWQSSDSDHPEALARTTIHLPVNVSFHLTEAEEPELLERCDNQSPWVHNLVMTFVMNVGYTAMGHDQEISGSFIQRVVCHPPELPSIPSSEIIVSNNVKH